MKINVQKAAVALFFVAVTVGIFYAGWQIFLINAQYENIGETPQAQTVGPPDAGIVIVEFMDYRCRPCRQLSPVVKEVIRNHPEVKFIFRNRPVPINNDQSIMEAKVAMAAGMQGRYMAMHDLLMSHEEPVPERDIEELARQAGVDYQQLRKDMNDPKIAATIDRSVTATRILNIRSVPTFVIGKEIYRTNYGMPTAADFDRLIAKARGGKAPASAQASPEKGSKG
jgi:protein-disulfide isomerase